MLIHEVRRRADEAPEHVFAGRKLQFKANEAGDVVCDVPDEIAQDLLDAVGSAMVAYGAAAQAPRLTPSAAPVAAPAQAPAEAQAQADASAGRPNDDQSAGQGGSDGEGQAAGDKAKFAITSPGGETFDLGQMSDAEVREFAVQAGLAKPHHTKKGDALRQFVIDSLKAA